MPKISIGRLVASKGALGRLQAQSMSAVVAYRIAKVARVVEQELAAVEIMRSKLAQEMGDPVEGKAGAFKIRDENVQAFNEQMQELAEEQVDLEFKKLTIDDLARVDMSPADILALGWMIDGLEEPDEADAAAR